ARRDSSSSPARSSSSSPIRASWPSCGRRTSPLCRSSWPSVSAARGPDMPESVKMAFDPKGMLVPIGQILPVRTVRPETRNGQQYLRLSASIREIGLIEPLIIYPQERNGKSEQRYTLLDGHYRLDVLKELGRTEVFCLIATDDEAFTFNHKVNRMSPIQE